MKTSPTLTPAAAPATEPAAWQPEVDRLVTRIGTVPVPDRARAAAALVASLDQALRAAGVDLQVSVACGSPQASSGGQPADPAVVQQAVQRALARGEARLVGWTRDGTLIDSARLAQAWGVRRQTLDAARARGEVFSLWIKGQHWYPADLLKFERTVFARIHAALGEKLDPSAKLLFLLHRHGALHGRTPAEAAADMPDEVVRLAAAWSRGD